MKTNNILPHSIFNTTSLHISHDNGSNSVLCTKFNINNLNFREHLLPLFFSLIYNIHSMIWKNINNLKLRHESSFSTWIRSLDFKSRDLSVWAKEMNTTKIYNGSRSKCRVAFINLFSLLSHILDYSLLQKNYSFSFNWLGLLDPTKQLFWAMKKCTINKKLSIVLKTLN